MVNKIGINFDVLEMMVFYWESIASREKVADAYLIEVSEKPAMAPLYGADFTQDSVRKVLSAIGNRELLNKPSKQESRFWSNNMWMLEDLNNMRNMLQPIKTLNLDEFRASVSGGKYESLELFFIPGHETASYIEGNKVYINFFKLFVDPNDATRVQVEGMPFKDYVETQLRKALS